jgi:hypothetical protein
MGDVDRILGFGVEEEKEIELPDEEKPAVSREGDIWTVGRHRIICGNSLRTETYAALLGSDEAAMVFTDPPYNVPVDGHVSGLGRVKHREFAMASAEMSKPEFIAFLGQVFATSWRIRPMAPFTSRAWNGRGARGFGKCVLRTEEPLRLGQDQRGHELVLPLAARAGFRLQIGRAAHVNNLG